MDKSRTFAVVDGGRFELERKKRLLFSRPWAFDHEEFERLCETLGLSRSEVFDLTTERIRHKAKTS